VCKLAVNERWLERSLGSVKGRIIIPLDMSDALKARDLICRMMGIGIRFFKVGKELLSNPETAATVIAYLKKRGCWIFVDVKLFDIPDTVAGAIRGYVKLGVHVVNLHALGGLEMMKAAIKAAKETAAELKVVRPLIFAVTVLTSQDCKVLRQTGILKKNPKHMTKKELARAMRTQVLRLARLAKKAGVDGVIASALHASEIKRICGDDFMIISPGIRFPGGDTHDQKQVQTPFGAMASGSTWLVIGRAITGAKKLSETVRRAIDDMIRGLKEAA
jgi:orotidine-5'-phosphate decarboxylase